MNDMQLALRDAGLSIPNGEQAPFVEDKEAFQSYMFPEGLELPEKFYIKRTLIASAFKHSYKKLGAATPKTGPNIICEEFRYVFGEGFVDYTQPSLKLPFMEIDEPNININDVSQYILACNRAIRLSINKMRQYNVSHLCLVGFTSLLLPKPYREVLR